MPSILWLSHSHRWYSFSLGLSGATCNTHHTYITYIHPFNGPLSETTWVSRYQKGKTNLDFTEETVGGSGISWATCTSAPRSREINHTSTPPLSFLQAGCPSCCPTNSIKALKAFVTHTNPSHISLSNIQTRWTSTACFINRELLHPLNGLFSRTTWVSWYQKRERSLDVSEARDDGVWGCSGNSWTICKQSAPRSIQITTSTPRYSISTGRMLFLMPNQQC